MDEENALKTLKQKRHNTEMKGRSRSERTTIVMISGAGAMIKIMGLELLVSEIKLRAIRTETEVAKRMGERMRKTLK